jgi:hypothetical protein
MLIRVPKLSVPFVLFLIEAFVVKIEQSIKVELKKLQFESTRF